MDITAIADQIEKITSKAPSSGGVQRNVWFVGDLVGKKDQYGEDEPYCKQEHRNFLIFRDLERKKGVQKFRFGRAWGTIKVPEMVLTGDDCIIAERAAGEHLLYWAKDCPEAACKDRKNKCPEAGNHDPIWCNDCYEYRFATHVKGCRIGKIIQGVDNYAERYLGLEDMHHENFLWDEETRTAWLVDIAE